MHLIEDAAQPDHVRNDAHPEDSLFKKNPLNGSRYFETWAKEEDDLINSFATNPIYPNVPLNISHDGLAPITQLFDTDLYDGLNASAGINQGIAEYTNANFFSDDTVFAAERYSTNHRHYFPFPRKESTDLASFIAGTKPTETIIDDDGNTATGVWISKTSDGEAIGHFVRASYLSDKIYALFGEGTLFYSTFYRDEECHKDYASLLIPRAVGYSAGLLDYFFRGSIEITIPDIGIYAQSGDASAGFTRITLLAKNITPGTEEMTGGSIELVVRYKLAQDDPFQSNPVPTDTEFTYVTVPESNNANSIPRGSATVLTFGTGQSTIIPLWATDVYLQVVFRGRLGNEDGAVAVGFKDISEPTPVDLFNNMDKICLNGGWYNTGSPEAINQVDPNHDGIPDWDIYTHNINNAYLKISNINDPINASPSNYTFYTPLITFGTLYRAYVLSDYEYTFNYSNYMTGVTTTSEDTWTHANGGIITGSKAASAIKNQVDYHVESQTECDTVGATAPCDIRYYPIFYPFRSINIWGPAGYIIDNPKYPIDTNCLWELLP